MEIKFFCPQWGLKHLQLDSFFEKVKNAGYDGVEMSLPLDNSEKELALRLLGQFDLLHIAQHWETLTPDFQEHKIEYRKRLENLASANPLFINSQTGKDYFSFEQNADLIEIGREVSHDYGVKIVHETHRGKFSFAAHITADYLNRLPDLRLTLDISHWCNVAESYLDDQREAIKLAISRTDHVHARVGFQQGPQVPDPRVPEWQDALLVHQNWWKEVVKLKEKTGQQIFTVTPEFGPYPYMTIMPFTRQPVTDQWEVNVFMMNYLKSFFIS
jgi:sugar phosphate isomerase/epimerase